MSGSMRCAKAGSEPFDSQDGHALVFASSAMKEPLMSA